LPKTKVATASAASCCIAGITCWYTSIVKAAEE